MLGLVLAVLVNQKPAYADLVVTNARIWTDGRVTDADSMAVVHGRITYVGKSSPDLVGPNTEIVSAQRHLVIPGIIDCYTHLAQNPSAAIQLTFKATQSKDEVLKELAAYAATVKPGQWIRAEDVPSTAQITKDDLDPITGDRPTILLGSDGKTAFVNTAAMVLAQISKDGPADPTDGQIERNGSSHEPTGVLHGSAVVLVPTPQPAAAQEFADFEGTIKRANSQGVTAVADVCSLQRFELWKRYESAGKPTIRAALYANQPQSWQQTVASVKSWPSVDGWAQAKGVACAVDGTVEQGTAYMAAPYGHPVPGQQYPKGLEVPDMQDGTYTKGFGIAAAAGLQILIHASGDQAVHDTLNVISSMPKAQTGLFRIQGADYIQPSDQTRLIQLGIGVTLDPYGARNRASIGQSILGPNYAQKGNAFSPFLAAHIDVAFGSVSPPAPIDPFAAIQGAIVDRSAGQAEKAGEDSLFDEALTCYTVNAAFAIGREKDLGRLAPGYDADFVILNAFPAGVNFDYSSLQPDEVYVDGRQVFSSGS